MQPSLSIFANFFIDNEERFLRLKDSFFSFRDAHPDEWNINIRGRLKYRVKEFLHSEINGKLNVYFRESRRGWFYDSYSFMKDVGTDYVFFWIEDHICLVDPTYLKYVVKDMSYSTADQLLYSWHHSRTLQTYSKLPCLNRLRTITTYNINKHSARLARQELERDFWIVSVASIFKKDFFLSILKSKRPYLKRWPHHLPFDFEKKSTDGITNQIITALPNIELFAAIDDDHGIPGYSLISRQLYPNRVSRDEMKRLDFPVSRNPLLFLYRGLPKVVAYPMNYFITMLKRTFYTINSPRW